MTWLKAVVASWVLVGGVLPAWGQGRLEGHALKLYGGRYSIDCTASNAPQLRVLADALTVETGGKRMTGGNVQVAHSYFGRSAPADYQVALVSEVRKDLQLIFIVFRDAGGQYITAGGDPNVEAALGKALLGKKFRSCESAAAASAPRPAPVAPQTEAMIGPPELLMDGKFKSVYYRALGSLVREEWLAKLDGPAPPVRKITAAGQEYALVSACKNHDCADNNAVLLYSAAEGALYGKIFLRRRSSIIGAPSSAMASELDRLWILEWRRNR